MLFNINIQHFPLPLRHKTQGVKKSRFPMHRKRQGALHFVFLVGILRIDSVSLGSAESQLRI